ncbi:MAG: hypothetical protein QXU23_02005 [Candidatus Korarchaeum sp.]
MRRSIERVFEGASRSFYDWLSSMELSVGRLHANPLASFLSCVVAVSLASFSSRVSQVLFIMVLSSIILVFCNVKRFRRYLKLSLAWFSFTLVIMLPRMVQEIGTILLPLRVAAALLTLSTFIELVGARRLMNGIDGLLAPLLGGSLATALEVMVNHIGKYVRSLGRLVLAKASRLIEGGLTGDYSIISLAASDLFFRGSRDAFYTSLVLRSRMFEAGLSNSPRDTSIILAIAFTYALTLLA